MHSVRGRIGHIVPDDRRAPRCDTVRSSAAPASAAWTEKRHAPGETRRHGRARCRRLPVPAAWRGGLGFWINDGQREQIQGTGGGADRGGGQTEIAGRGRETAMTQQKLNFAYVGSGFE